MGTVQSNPPTCLTEDVKTALTEDVGSGDITAALIPATQQITADIICREPAILCGAPWVDDVFKQLDPSIKLDWHFQDGDSIKANDILCNIQGNTRSILTGERTALNFLQTLSGTATLAQQYASTVSGTNTTLLDTRKTIPGLRQAQKYAVRCGGCSNHRHGLYDAYLIKENHIAATGGIKAAITQARQNHPNLLLEIEVESLAELEEALACKPDRILLDNFNLEQLKQAVALTDGDTELEASGDIILSNIQNIAETGVNYISLGALTKHIKAVDLSLLINSNLIG